MLRLRRSEVQNAIDKYTKKVESMTAYTREKLGDILEVFPVGQTAIVFDYWDYVSMDDNRALADSNEQAVKARFGKRHKVSEIDGCIIVKVKSNRRKLVTWAIVEDILNELDDYPILDEYDFVEREENIRQETFDSEWNSLNFLSLSDDEIDQLKWDVYTQLQWDWGCNDLDLEGEFYPALQHVGMVYIPCWHAWTYDAPVTIPHGADKCVIAMDNDHYAITWGYFAETEISEGIVAGFGNYVYTKMYNVAVPTKTGFAMATMSEHDICFLSTETDQS